MARPIQCYEDATGNLHREPFDAWRADLIHWLAQIDEINEASAKKLAERIAGSEKNTDEVMGMLYAIQENRPAQRPIAATYTDDGVSE